MMKRLAMTIAICAAVSSNALAAHMSAPALNPSAVMGHRAGTVCDVPPQGPPHSSIVVDAVPPLAPVHSQAGTGDVPPQGPPHKDPTP